ncbi:hypothetical protein [Halomontanus rarus]
MTASWTDLFDRAAATDGTHEHDIETICAELERQRERRRTGDDDA